MPRTLVAASCPSHPSKALVPPLVAAVRPLSGDGDRHTRDFHGRDGDRRDASVGTARAGPCTDPRRSDGTMTTYLVNHLRVPGLPKPQNLEYLAKVEATDRATARRWYASPEYQDILGLRTDNAVSDLVLVDPVAPDVTSAGWARQIRAALAADPDPAVRGTDTSEEQP
jgi:hypothetical protein